MDHDNRFSQERRNTLKLLGTLVAAAGLLPTALRAGAEPENAVDEASDQAKALGYRHQSSLVDSKAYPRHQMSQNCLNCQLYQSKEAWGPCALFPGKQVSAEGWCGAWVQRAG